MVLPVDACATIIPVIQAADLSDQNGLMGHLMFVERVINDVLDAEDASCPELEAALVQQLPMLLERNSCPPTRAAFIRCVDAYGRLTKRWQPAICQTTIDAAMSILTASARQPGSDLLDAAAAQIVLRPGVVDQDRVAVLLGPTVFEDVRLLAIDASEIMHGAIGAMATDEEESNAIRIRALEWLQRSDAVVEDIAALRRAVEQRRCVPLREAALPVLAQAAAALSDPAQSLSVLRLIDAAAHEEEVSASMTLLTWQSHESRFAAVLALAHFTSILFRRVGDSAESYFTAHRALYTLLIDDDDEVRAEASTIVGRGSVMVQGRAVDQWWRQATEYVAESEGAERTMWIEWLWSIAVNKDEIGKLPTGRADHRQPRCGPRNHTQGAGSLRA